VNDDKIGIKDFQNSIFPKMYYNREKEKERVSDLGYKEI